MTEAPDIAGSQPPRLPAGSPDARQAGLNLLRRLLVYHLLLGAAVTVLLTLYPSLATHLPIGGVTVLAEGTGLVETEFPVQTGPGRFGYAGQLVLALAGIWLLMLPVSWVHRGTHRSATFDHSLDKTTMILPGVVASIVLVVQYSLALAFALAGVVAGVQFRRALQDTFDALFILMAIGTGIAAGVEALEVAAVMTVFFCYATLYVCRFGDGFESDYLAERKELKRRLKARPDPDVDPGTP